MFCQKCDIVRYANEKMVRRVSSTVLGNIYALLLLLLGIAIFLWGGN